MPRLSVSRRYGADRRPFPSDGYVRCRGSLAPSQQSIRYHPRVHLYMIVCARTPADDTIVNRAAIASVSVLRSEDRVTRPKRGVDVEVIHLPPFSRNMCGDRTLESAVPTQRGFYLNESNISRLPFLEYHAHVSVVFR